MIFKSTSCPNCGGAYNPAKYQCEYCGSYIFMSNSNYTDFSEVKIELQNKPKDESGKNPGIYVYGRLLGKGETPITLGVANYFTGMITAGGKLLLTNKSLSFSAHAFNVGRKETTIALKDITDVKVGANFLVSQQILVIANGETHKFVVYHGKEWVQKIRDAINNYEEKNEVPVSHHKSRDYVEELQELKKMLDAEIITEDEFNIKKRMLLGL